MAEQDKLHAMRHSMAHIAATAAMRLWPEAKLGVGPVVENGFYYDIDLGGKSISEDNFGKIEKEMKKVIASNVPFERFELPIDEAIDWAKESKQPYKQELLNDLKRAGTTVAKDLDADELGTITDGDTQVKSVSFYRNGDFTDLCRGPHVESTGKVGAFKLMRVAGAYWRGKDTNPQMQRLYGVAFETQEELDHFLKMQEEAKARDHRKLGKELDLFSFSELVGKGLPLWNPRGAKMRRLLERFTVEEEERRGYQHVITPDMASLSLYERSGHYPYYKESMYAPIEIDDEKFMLRPMTCPHHFQIYKERPRTYKELPMRIAELGKLYRYEKSGELSGLTRVRSFTLADSHIICTKEQVTTEIEGALDLIEYCATVFGLKKGKDYLYRLSLGDRSDDGKYYKDDASWEHAEKILRDTLVKRDEPFYEAEGEAAFYGPKIDIQMKNTLGKEDTAFTVQYDFVMPKRFELTYIDEMNQEQEPVVVHRSSIGAVERIFAFLTEFYAGWFPFWLAPEQVRILTINDTVNDYVAKVKEVLESIVLMKPVKYNEVRYAVDDRNESLGRKIRDAVGMKIPVTLIIGPKDAEAGEVSVRLKDGEQKVALSKLNDFLTSL